MTTCEACGHGAFDTSERSSRSLATGPSRKPARSCTSHNSAVSRQLSRLEAELGITRFTRSSRSVELTAEGPLVLDALGDEFAATLLSEEEFICAMPVGHEFAGQSHVTFPELAGHDSSPIGENSARRHRLEQTLDGHEQAPPVRLAASRAVGRGSPRGWSLSLPAAGSERLHPGAVARRARIPAAGYEATQWKRFRTA